MTDHQQAAIEAGARAYDPEAWTAYDRESPSTEGRELMVEYSKSKAESILAAAEPHLRKKWAEELYPKDDPSHEYVWLMSSDDSHSLGSIDISHIAEHAAKIAEGEHR